MSTPQYPTLTVSDTIELARRRLEGLDSPTGPCVNWKGTGSRLDLEDLRAALEPLETQLAAGQQGDTEVFEGHVAAVVHQHLRDIEVEVLDDRGFWRYVGIELLWWFTSWRERTPLENGSVAKYVDNLRPTEAIPIRLFLRGAIAHEGETYERAWRLPRSTDLWRSHILRVRTGSVPAMAQALLDLQSDVRMRTELLRPYARRINRMWANVIPNVYESADARKLLDEAYAAATLPAPTPVDDA